MKNKKLLTFLIYSMLISTLILAVGCSKEEKIYVTNTEELVEAVKKDDAFIVIKNDIDINGDVRVTGKNVTLDLNGKKIYNSEDIWTDDVWSLINVDGGEITITGNGQLDAKENDCYAFSVENGGKCVIENGTYFGNVTVGYAREGEIIVNGGKFELKQIYIDHRYTLNCYDSAYRDESAKIAVKGGTFVEFNPANNLAEGENTSFILEGYKSTYDEENKTYTVTKLED